MLVPAQLNEEPGPIYYLVLNFSQTSLHRSDQSPEWVHFPKVH